MLKICRVNLNVFSIKRYLHSSNEIKKKKPSYFHTPGKWPLLGQTIGQMVDESAAKFGTKEAVVFCESRIRKNFIQLKEDVEKFAAGLLAIGLQKGDRIGIWSPNHYEFLLTQYASAKAGLLLVNLNPAYQSRELAYSLKKVGVRAIVCAETFRTQNYYDVLRGLLPSIPDSSPGQIKDDNFTLSHVIMISNKDFKGTFKFNDVANLANETHFQALEDLQPKIQFDDPCNIQFTSGTTGNPKGTILSHFNLVNDCIAFGMRIRLSEKSHRACIPLPLYHAFGCVVGSLSSLKFGACQVYPSSLFNAKATAEALHHEKCTAVYGIPTMFMDMLNLPDVKDYDFSNINTGAMGGANCPPEVMKSLQEHNIRGLSAGYGCTEITCGLSASRPDDSFELRWNTVGYPLEHSEVKIIDTSTGNVVPCGEIGELCTRGSYVMLGYWGDEEKTKESITTDRWYKTGDLATTDENGYIKIEGRIKDMIIRGGENIFPKEIENFLHTHPKIAEAQVFGVPDERLGEEVWVAIRLKTGENLTEEEVRTFCKDQLSYFKIPRYIRFVDSFPMTVTGKVQKFILRDMATKDWKN